MKNKIDIFNTENTKIKTHYDNLVILHAWANKQNSPMPQHQFDTWRKHVDKAEQALEELGSPIKYDKDFYDKAYN